MMWRRPLAIQQKCKGRLVLIIKIPSFSRHVARELRLSFDSPLQQDEVNLMSVRPFCLANVF